METLWKLIAVAFVLAAAYAITAALNPSLANYITNLVTLNWDALDWGRVNL